MALSASGSGRGDGGEALKQRIIAFKGLLATRSQRTLARFRTLRVAERPPRSVPTIGLSAAQNRAVGRAEKCESLHTLTHSSQQSFPGRTRETDRHTGPARLAQERCLHRKILQTTKKVHPQVRQHPQKRLFVTPPTSTVTRTQSVSAHAHAHAHGHGVVVYMRRVHGHLIRGLGARVSLRLNQALACA